MFKRISFLLLILTAAALPVFSQGGSRPLFFAESWNKIAYYETNAERVSFSSLLGRLEGKLGFNLFGSPLQAYGVYYGVLSQDSSYWNNAVYYGAGVRLKPFENYRPSSWLNEWLPDLKIFAESLNANYFQNAASAEGSPKEDLRYGLEVWHEWNLDQPDYRYTWGELWTNLSYRSTDFSESNFNDYIFYFQPKLGWHWGGGLEPYLKADLTYSGKSSSWRNTLLYGGGFRLQPWRLKADKDSLLKKFKIFVEVLRISYLKDKPAREIPSDVRFGVDFSYGL